MAYPHKLITIETGAPPEGKGGATVTIEEQGGVRTFRIGYHSGLRDLLALVRRLERES